MKEASKKKYQFLIKIIITRQEITIHTVSIQIPKNEGTIDHEVITEPVINRNYNHGKESIPVVNNEITHEAIEASNKKLSIQNVLI